MVGLPVAQHPLITNGKLVKDSKTRKWLLKESECWCWWRVWHYFIEEIISWFTKRWHLIFLYFPMINNIICRKLHSDYFCCWCCICWVCISLNKEDQCVAVFLFTLLWDCIIFSKHFILLLGCFREKWRPCLVSWHKLFYAVLVLYMLNAFWRKICYWSLYCMEVSWNIKFLYRTTKPVEFQHKTHPTTKTNENKQVNK